MADHSDDDVFDDLEEDMGPHDPEDFGYDEEYGYEWANRDTTPEVPAEDEPPIPYGGDEEIDPMAGYPEDYWD